MTFNNAKIANNLLYLQAKTIEMLSSKGYRQCSTGHSGFPRDEWSHVREVLMHTPGEEVFDGVIHSEAGLFEQYFDVDKAAVEHKHYIEVLAGMGIRVHTVDGILNELEPDILRHMAGRVLTYDISCDPGEDPAATESLRQETLGRMSRADLIRCILFRPTVKLSRTSGNTGYEAEYILKPLMNLYFTRDQSITTPKGHIICQMNSTQRVAETEVIEQCYSYLGRLPILRIQGEGRLEGGDYFPAGDMAFIGCGMRTNYNGIRQIMEADAFGHDTIVVVRDHKLWQRQMHLDTWFNIIDRDLCTMAGSRLNASPGEPEYATCDIWTRNPGTLEYSLERENVSFVSFIRETGMEIIPISHPDEMNYAGNYLTVAPRKIVAVAGQGPEFRRCLLDAGVEVIWIPLENLIRGYGAAHCMTQVLSRAL